MFKQFNSLVNHIYKDTTVSTVHALSTCFLVWNETPFIALLFSGLYFVIDLLGCVLNKDYIFGLHAVIALFLISNCFTNEVYIEIKAYKILYTELSTPLLNLWKVNKKKSHFVYFSIVFFFCRIVYIPYVIYDSILDIYTVEMGVLAGLYILNLIWFIKILDIFKHYKSNLEKE